MERIAAVVVPALPLQLLLRHNPSWRAHPTVVVADDRPQGKILWVNTLARHAQVLPGMSFASARNLATDLRASVVPSDQIADANGQLFVKLCGYSPRVEAIAGETGAFWLDPSGLISLYGSISAWAAALLATLRAEDLSATAVIGFHRFRTHALARTRSGVHVMPDARYERRLADGVGLTQLPLDPDLRDQLLVLGVRTLGDLLRLPAPELRARFGEEAARLHAAASDDWVTLVPRPLVDPVVDELQLDPPDDDHTRLLFGLRSLLHRMRARLAQRGQALVALRLRLDLDHAAPCELQLAPAQPTLDDRLLLELVRLRLESLRLPAAVAGAHVELEGIRTSAAQLALFHSRSRRDLVAGARALARVRAALGDNAVTRAELRPAHLPEARFAWVPITAVDFPGPIVELDLAHPPPLQRRVFPRPLPLPARPRHEPEGWLGRHGAVVRMHGPFRTSGGWWVRTVERDYYYAETKLGALLWIYFDRPRQRWFWHGVVD